MNKWMIVLGVGVIALGGGWTHSLQKRVDELERRLEDASQAEFVPPIRRPTTSHPSMPPLRDLGAIERRVALLEQRELDPVDPPPVDTRARASAPSGGSTVLDGDSIADLVANFGLYDSNGDGLLDAEELLVPPSELKTFDLNSDHRLGVDEVDRLRELSANAREAAKRLDSADAAFPITREDFGGGPRRFHFLDRDDDGLVSESEYVASLTTAIKELRRFDLDHNGALTAAELWDAPTRFAASDQDGDGLVYAWEVSSLMARAKW